MKRALALFASAGLAIVALMVTAGSSSGQGTIGPSPVTGVTTGGGLTKTGPRVGLALCAANEVPKMNGAGTAWTCGTAAGVVVDLSSSPYNVVAGSTGAADANTAAINQAIVDYDGTHARLVLPIGIIYIDQANTNNNWSIYFSSTINDVALVGHGMFSTFLAQYGPGDTGDWNGIQVHGSRIELADFGIYQDTITFPDSIQQHHLISVQDNATDVYGHDIYFGKSLGDQLRCLGDSAAVTNMRFSRVLMHGAGTVTSTPPNGRVGSRSGFATQRNCNRVELSDFYIDGAQNSGIDEEPTAGAGSYITIRNGTVDNTSGLTAYAVSLGGESGGTADTHQRVSNLTIINGTLSVLSTQNLTIDGLVMRSTQAFAADSGTPLITIRQSNQDITLTNMYLERSGSAAVGGLLDIENPAGRTTITDSSFVQAVNGQPVLIDDASDVTIRGVRVRYSGATPSARSAIQISAINGNSNRPTIDDVSITTASGKFFAGIYLAVRTPRTMSNIRVSNLHGAGYATNCIATSLGAGGTIDTTPQFIDTECGSDGDWYSGDASDAPVTTLYPITQGARSGIASYEGTASTPEGALAAVQGSTYTYKAGNSTTRWVKVTGTGNTGWTQVVNATGDIESVTAGSGLTGGGASGSVTVDVGAGANITVNANDVALSNDVAISGSLTVGDLRGTTASPSSISGTVNDWSISGSATFVNVSASATSTLTGITGGASGRIVVLTNTSAESVTLSDENVGSIAANRFELMADDNVLMLASRGDSVILRYESGSSRWKQLGTTTLPRLYVTGAGTIAGAVVLGSTATVSGDFTSEANSQLGNSNTDTVSSWGKTNFYGTAPTLSSCTGGTIASYSTDARGHITFDGTATGTCTLTFSAAYSTNKPACSLALEDCGDVTLDSSVVFSSVSTSSFSIQAVVGDLDNWCVHYRCDGML